MSTENQPEEIVPKARPGSVRVSPEILQTMRDLGMEEEFLKQAERLMPKYTQRDMNGAMLSGCLMLLSVEIGLLVVVGLLGRIVGWW